MFTSLPRLAPLMLWLIGVTVLLFTIVTEPTKSGAATINKYKCKSCSCSSSYKICAWDEGLDKRVCCTGGTNIFYCCKWTDNGNDDCTTTPSPSSCDQCWDGACTPDQTASCTGNLIASPKVSKCIGA
jgi:hypothetical protein